MISHEHKFIFIHIPKCAGSSIEQSLFGEPHVEWDQKRKIWKQHATAAQIREYYCNDYNSYYSFAFVRNPWDKIVSDYFWIQKNWRIKDTFKNYLTLKGKFNDPRLRFPPTSHRTRYDHIIPQCNFILDDKDEAIVKFIGRFENLQSDFDTICDKIGIPRKELLYTNRTWHDHYTKYYDDETRQIVAEKYAKDIEYFGYKFGE